MRYLLDFVYLSALILLSPWLIYRSFTTRKYRRGMWHKLTGRIDLPVAPTARAAGPRLWFHAVSVGEVHLLRPLVARLRNFHPEWQVVISTTTDTGYDEAKKRFAGVPVIFWPLDFSWAVRRSLREVRPDLVVLAEGEMWPNFLLAARQVDVPVAVINGRMSPRSLGRYRKLARLVRPLLTRIDLFAMQNEAYAANMRLLGAPAERVLVTGNIKYDGVEHNRRNARTEELRRLLRIESGDLVWICGSTQAPEEELALGIFQRALGGQPRLRLFIVPRQKERFDDVAALLKRSGLPFVRRSELKGPVENPAAIVLVDTIGELGALWGLADVAYVGGSMDGKRGGQNMIEPAAYGAAVLFGPHTWNFRADVERLLKSHAAIQVDDARQLEEHLAHLFADAGLRERLGQNARWLVEEQQGATERTVRLLEELLAAKGKVARAA
jgi:3-deoxy-D-manno-octulosonic-acid transferase